MTLSSRLVALLCIACLLVGSAGLQAQEATHLYVKLRPGVSPRDVSTLAAQGAVSYTPFDVPGWLRLRALSGQASKLHEALARDPRVLAVEGEHRLCAALTPNDTYWGLQWGPDKIGVPIAWNVTTGSASVVVAVLDSGVDVDHPDLTGQLWVNPGEIADNGLDDDGNGKVDDVNGWRFNHIGSTPYESNDVNDEYGHGTHVSGIVGAVGNNGLGVAGMAWGSSIMTVRVLDAAGKGWYSDVAAGVVYAVDNGAQVINLSLGGSDDDALLRDAVGYAYVHGVLVTAAAGNSSYGDYDVLYPAVYDTSVAVAASTSGDYRASFSRYGPEVDLTAPGETIYSTGTGGSYYYSSGTSMATPHVSGLAALIWSWQPTMTITQVTQLMVDTAVDIGSPGWDQYTGWGRIDAGRALVPVVPTKVYLPLVTRAYEAPGAVECTWIYLPLVTRAYDSLAPVMPAKVYLPLVMQEFNEPWIWP
jgi:subtilisin family serine protease